MNTQVTDTYNFDFSTLLNDKETRNSLKLQPPVPTAKARYAHEFIAQSGIVEQIEKWTRADHEAAGKSAGGRPAMISARLLLTLFVILATENTPLHVTRLADLLHHRLGAKAQAVLGLNGSGATHNETYHRLWRATARMLDAIDPTPYPKRKRLNKGQFAEVMVAREADSVQLEVKRARRDWVMNQLLEATLEALPREHRRWKGNVAVDATPVKLFAKGVGKKKQADMESDGRLSIQPDAGFYARDGDHRDVEAKGRPARKSFYAVEAELITQVTNDPSLPADFPLLIAAIGIHAPGVAPTERALEAFQSLNSRGHPAGFAVGDRLYFPNAIAEKLQLPLRQMGYKIVGDYQDNQLGQQTTHKGAILVEGNWFSPGMPTSLQNATKVLRNTSHKDYGNEELYRKRITARTLYLLKEKQKPDADGFFTWMCPAGGPNPTVTCAIKTMMGINDPSSPTNAGRNRTLLPVLNFPEPKDQDTICTNRTSVKFEPEAGAKFFQHLQYGTDEWHAWFSTARNTIEGFNAYVKDPSYEALDASGRRRLRGVTAQYFLTTMLVAAANLRKISNFIHGKETASPVTEEAKAKARAKRRKTSARPMFPVRGELIGAPAPPS
jgi:hypothetical protein